MKARFLALAALVLGLASCQTEPEGLDVNVGGEVDTVVTVSLPETTRANSALGAFENVDWAQYTIRYQMKIYDSNGRVSDAIYETYLDGNEGNSVTFPVRLVPNRQYSFVAWADIVKDTDHRDLHYDTTDLKNITLKSTWVAMDETRDAYTDVETLTYYGNTPVNLQLIRPFAKLRVVTTDMVALNNLDIVPTTATVEYTVDHYNAFNALAGSVIGDSKNRDIKHEEFSFTSYGEDVVNGADMTLFTDYFFAKSEEEPISFILTVYDQNGVAVENIIKTNNFSTDIPVQRNYLTTIQGNVLTDSNNVKVTVTDGFENGSGWNPTEDEYDVEIVDVHDTDSLKAAIANAEADVVINANGAEINLNYGLSTTSVPEGKTVTICNANVIGKSYGNGVNGTVIFENCTFNNPTGAYSIHFDNGNGDVIFNNCDLYGWNSFGASLNSVSFENCTLTGNGTYALIRSYVDLSLKDCVINITDANHTDNYSEGVEAVGEATMEEDNVVYEVSNQMGLSYTLKAGVKNITLLEGEYELSELVFADGAYTLKGADNVVLKLSKSIYLSNKSLTLENLTFKVPAGLTYTEANFAFIHHATTFNMNNCVIEGGRLRLNVNNANIDNCQFDVTASSGFDGYGLFYYGNNNSTINISNSTFTALQKAVVLYNEGAVTMNLNVEDCTFTASQTTDKAAISIHSELGINGNVNIRNSSATGFADYNGGLWRDVNNNTGTNNNKFNVTVDGVQVQVAGYTSVANGVFLKDGVYYISNVAGLKWVEEQTDAFFSGKTIKLMNDIDCADATINPTRFWDPENPTIFDGQEHTISNLEMNMSSVSNVALFNGTATIKNLNVTGATIVGNGYVGVIGGNLYGNIINCHVTKSTVTGNYWQVGGLVGQYNSGKMENCSVTETTITGPSAVGALAGIWNESGNRTFKECNVENCAINQNYSFGSVYDTMYGVLSGCANVNNTTFTVDTCIILNNTIKGVSSETLVGELATGSTLEVK